MSKIVYLEITSWGGISLGAEHYYGKLISHNNVGYEEHYGIKSFEIYKSMTEREAQYLNEKDDWDNYKAGTKNTRFETKEEIINIACKIWKEQFPECEILIEGRSVVADPQLCLDGPEDLKSKINNLYYKAEEIDFYDGGHKKEMNKIFKEFDNFMNVNGLS